MQAIYGYATSAVKQVCSVYYFCRTDCCVQKLCSLAQYSRSTDLALLYLPVSVVDMNLISKQLSFQFLVLFTSKRGISVGISMQLSRQNNLLRICSIYCRPIFTNNNNLSHLPILLMVVLNISPSNCVRETLQLSYTHPLLMSLTKI